MPSQEEIFSKVQEALVDALGVEEEEVTPEATLQGDLDAESIDFLDIVFRLKRLSTSRSNGRAVPRGTSSPTPNTTKRARSTRPGLAQLKERMPFADLSKFEADPVVQNLGKQLTVQDMCNFVEFKLSA